MTLISHRYLYTSVNCLIRLIHICIAEVVTIEDGSLYSGKVTSIGLSVALKVTHKVLCTVL